MSFQREKGFQKTMKVVLSWEAYINFTLIQVNTENPVFTYTNL